jgi:bifunctional DNA-binding transcriptional regulator/antitoxin component of YhaV-PrlF toxin-antitoxin module
MPQTQIRVRDKGQVTLPMSIVRDAHIQPNDVLSVDYRNGVIMMYVNDAQPKKRSVQNLVGMTSGLYGRSAADIDAYLSADRDSWER